MTVKYQEIKPGGTEQLAASDALARSIALMDEADRAMKRYLVVTREQRTAMLLYAMGTHALQSFDSYGRVKWEGEPESGKTTGMKITGALSANARSVTGTTPAVRSLLAQSALKPDLPMPVLMLDQVDKYYGSSGMNVGATIINDIMREGYVCDATMSWSANRTPVEFSIFCAVLMTGTGPLPYDIGTRTIVIRTEAGEPESYYDARHGRREMKQLGKSLGEAVRAVAPLLGEFEPEGVHPKLTGRLSEIWGPLYAVAWVLGGQEWLNRCNDAFEALALGVAKAALSPRQQMLKYIAELITTGPLAWAGDAGFVPGRTLATELLKLGRPEPGTSTIPEPAYAGRTQGGMEKIVSETLDLRTEEIGNLHKTRSPLYARDRMRGYFADILLAEWDKVRPATPRDVKLPPAVSPFDVSDDSDELSGKTAGKTSRPAARSGTSGTSGARKLQEKKAT